MPYVIEKTVSNIGAVATPLGLMALGASFDVQKALGKIKPVIAACMLTVSYTHLTLPTTSRQRQMCIRDSNRVAVHFKKYEFGMNKNGFLIK